MLNICNSALHLCEFFAMLRFVESLRKAITGDLPSLCCVRQCICSNDFNLIVRLGLKACSQSIPALNSPWPKFTRVGKQCLPAIFFVRQFSQKGLYQKCVLSGARPIKLWLQATKPLGGSQQGATECFPYADAESKIAAQDGTQNCRTPGATVACFRIKWHSNVLYSDQCRQA